MLLKTLKENDRLNETLFLGGLSLLCLAVSLFRFVYTDTKVFLFLNWNLFLAFVPWALSSVVILRPHLRRSSCCTTSAIGSSTPSHTPAFGE